MLTQISLDFLFKTQISLDFLFNLLIIYSCECTYIKCGAYTYATANVAVLRNRCGNVCARRVTSAVRLFTLGLGFSLSHSQVILTLRC